MKPTPFIEVNFSFPRRGKRKKNSVNDKKVYSVHDSKMITSKNIFALPKNFMKVEKGGKENKKMSKSYLNAHDE